MAVAARKGRNKPRSLQRKKNICRSYVGITVSKKSPHSQRKKTTDEASALRK